MGERTMQCRRQKMEAPAYGTEAVYRNRASIIVLHAPVIPQAYTGSQQSRPGHDMGMTPNAHQ
jgi:hypothetical protein